MPPSASPTGDFDQQPEKWQKYLLLEDFGLTSQEYLRQTIRRFPWDARVTMLEELRRQLSTAADEAFFVVKLVPRNLGHLLPNHRVYRAEDLSPLESELAASSGQFAETWFCRTKTGENNFSVGGRILIDLRNGEDSHTIEQLWQCSPRLLQSFGAEFKFPYVRATRAGWSWSPQIQAVYLPEGYPTNEAQLVADLRRAAGMLLRRRADLERLQDFIERCGMDVMSFEYKIEGNQLRFIDWDTADDRKVLAAWRRSGTHSPQ
jgi:hypothetical protein